MPNLKSTIVLLWGLCFEFLLRTIRMKSLQTTFIHLGQTDRMIARIWLVLFGGGVIAHLTPLLYPLTTYITDVLLFATNGIVLYRVHNDAPSRKRLYWLGVAATATFFIEVAGVATGDVFGNYHYGDTLLLQGLNVPFVIALNWAVLVLATTDFAARFTTNSFWGASISALIIIAFDLAMEPVAVALDYWVWEDGSIPVQNYFAWFVIAWGLAFALFAMRLTTDSKILRIYFFVQLGFFLSLLLFLV